jgi:hypothetical protein
MREETVILVTLVLALFVIARYCPDPPPDLHYLPGCEEPLK